MPAHPILFAFSGHPSTSNNCILLLSLFTELVTTAPLRLLFTTLAFSICHCVCIICRLASYILSLLYRIRTSPLRPSDRPFRRRVCLHSCYQTSTPETNHIPPTFSNTATQTIRYFAKERGTHKAFLRRCDLTENNERPLQLVARLRCPSLLS